MEQVEGYHSPGRVKVKVINHSFEHSLQRMNRVKFRAHVVYNLIAILRALAVAIIVMCLWSDVAQSGHLLHLVIGIVTFLGILRFSSLGSSHKISADSMLMALDIQYPGTNPSPFIAAASTDVFPDWDNRLSREEKRLSAWEWRRLTSLSGSLLVPLLLALLLLSKAPINISVALSEVKNVVTALTGGMTLDVLDGLAKKPDSKNKPSEPQEKTSFSLSSLSPPEISVTPTNMLRLTIIRVDAGSRPPVINLRPLDDTPPLTIQMYTASGEQHSGNVWIAEFSISHSSDVLIPEVSSKPLARVNVSEPPVPKVKLSLAAEVKDAWPDHEVVPLTIEANSVHPLDKINLRITSKDKTNRESVLNISGDTLQVNTTYKLNLQPWMEEDVLEFDIIAEATDRADPIPLTGLSQPLHLKVASAYGRYRNALDTLRQVKIIVDEARASAKPPAANLADTMARALKQSEETPFFDGLDRVELDRLGQVIATLAKEKITPVKLAAASDDLGQFLLEHEILDDRERDRDFFIAIRAYSRALDSHQPERSLESKHLAERMRNFLDERHKRWTLRVNRLGTAQEPSSWGKINGEKPFQGLVRLTAKDAAESPKKSQGHLSTLASEYRTWIEELEAKEDQVRAKQEQDRQQGLANARNELRELQQRQDQISSNLDRAPEQPQEAINQKWMMSKLQENSNIKQAKGLLQKLRALSPTAGERLEAAIDAMENTNTAGDGSQWADAERSADMAGRLLRDADQAANKSQKQRDRGRRRKTSGDDYHGTAIGGQVEIKSQYQVNPRYREDILKDVEDEMTSGENKNLLDGWLRQVVR
jgi:hypothetical protein